MVKVSVCLCWGLFRCDCVFFKGVIKRVLILPFCGIIFGIIRVKMCILIFELISIFVLWIFLHGNLFCKFVLWFVIILFNDCRLLMLQCGNFWWKGCGNVFFQLNLLTDSFAKCKSIPIMQSKLKNYTNGQEDSYWCLQA